MNFSSDFINISNEIASFNQTLNEMLSVWNDPTIVPQNINNTSSPSNNNNNNTTTTTLTNTTAATMSSNNNAIVSLNSSQQLEANINLILNNNNNSNNNNNISSSNNNNNNSINTNNNNNSLFKQSQTNGRSFLVSSNSNLESFLLENPSLFQSDDAIGKMSKVINEINRESKVFQPIEIVPLKTFQTSSSSTPIDTQSLQQTLPNFSTIPSFSLDASKLEELKTDLSFLDPVLSIPYYNHNNIPMNNQPILPPPQQPIIQQQSPIMQQQPSSPVFTSINNDFNNNTYTLPIKQESNSGPMRHTVQFDRSPVQPDSTMVTLSNAQLSSITSMEMDDYANATNVGKDLSTSEKKDLKRQKRLIKNRESAHLSRQRKRERLTDLEHHVEELTQNSSKLTGLLGGLENENLVLKAEVGQLIDVIRDSPVLSALFVQSTFMNLKQQQQHHHNQAPIPREVQVAL